MNIDGKTQYLSGLKAGWPIGLGYFAVSAAYGMAAVIQGLSVHQAVMISLTNLTSAGQFAGTALIAAAASAGELIVTQLIINARYFLMSVSLSQKVPEKMPVWQRMILSFGITDEIYALAVEKKGKIPFLWFLGLMTLPIIGWSSGTWLGASASSLLPGDIVNALGLAMYAMFIAIVIPQVKASRSMALCAAIAAVLSCLFAFLPVLSSISSGYVIVIVTILTAGFMAWRHPRQSQQNYSSDQKKGDPA